MKERYNLTRTTALILTSTTVVSMLALGGTAFADTTAGTGANVSAGVHFGHGMGGPGRSRIPGVFGTVSAINGTTLTVTSKMGGNDGDNGNNASATTYTVNAANATIIKGNATSSLSAIAIGDTVMVQGAVSGTSITATAIRDGVMRGGRTGVGGMMGARGDASSTAWHAGAIGIVGNGQPVVGGAVTAISGTTLTIINKSNVTYSVNAAAATVFKGNATSSISNVAVGDKVIVQGAVNGSSIVASSVIDQGAASTNADESNGVGMHARGMGGFFGAIGGFFQHLFGFF